MKTKLLLVLLALGVVWVTGQEPELSKDGLMQRAAGGPEGKRWVPLTGRPRFVLVEGPSIAGRRALFRMNVQSGETWTMEALKLDAGDPRGVWVPVLESAEK